MNWNPFRLQSLRARVTFLTLALFVVGIWSLATYVIITLRADLEQTLGKQQYAATSYVAADLNEELEIRQQALNTAAAAIGSATRGNAAAMQAYLEQRVTLLGMFNGGLFATDTAGTAVADVPRSAGRTGTNYMDRTTVSIPLTEGKSLIGKPAMGKKLQQPIFSMSAPIRDKAGQVIGVLVGTVNLALPNFLDLVVQHSYGKTGSYILLAPQHNLIVTATEKARTMQPIPPPGLSPLLDAFMKGYEGPMVGRNSRGVEVLASAKGIPVAGWIIVSSLPTAEAFAPIETLMARLFLGATVLTLVVSGLAWWITALYLRRQIAPILASTHAVRALASDLTKEVSPPLVPAGTSDEIGQLIDAFNQLTQNLGAQQESLRASEERLRRVSDNANVGLTRCSRDLIYLSANPAYAVVAGKPLDQIVGRPIVEVMGAEAMEAIRPYVERVLSGEHVTYDAQVPFIGSGQRYLHVSYTPDIDLDGQIVGWVASVTDITEQKQAEAQLHALAARLQSVREDERTRLARNVHDELGQLLTGLSLDLAWLEKRGARIADAELRQSMEDKIAEVEGLTHTMLASVQEIASELRPDALDHLGICAALRYETERFTRRGGIACVLDLPAVPLTLVPDTATVLFRIAQESLTNVARHAGATQVAIRLAASGADVTLVVHDDGSGISPEQLAAPDSLGLLGMRERAAQLCGTVTIVGEPGRGTTVTVTVPA